MPARALFSSFLLALILATGVSATASAANAPKAKVALIKKKAKKHKPCANTGIVPDAANLELFRDALVCLHNQVRAQNGLSALAENGALTAAGTGHSGDMVAHGYFDHTAPGGPTFDQRIIAAGYARANDGWSLGENLGWGTGTLATPAALMQAWMHSEHHRENVLKPTYRDIGIGIHLGTPTGDQGGVTISAEFGVRL